jgi:hypothetical protein
MNSSETIKFIQGLEILLKQLLKADDVQIIVDMDPDALWGGDDASLLETTGTGSKDRTS